MYFHDSLNVQRVFRTMAAEWKCPVWFVKITVQKHIDESWEMSMHDPEKLARWNQFFPDGKPTAEQYILRLGRAHEKGENVPNLIGM